MPLVLDIFGVVLLQQGLNLPLLEACASWRRDGEKIYGASNMSVLQNQELWQRHAEIRAAFDEIFCSGQLGVSKPDPLFYTAVADKIQALPEAILFFDDSGTNADAAQAMGWEAYTFGDNSDLHSIANGFFLRLRSEDKTVDRVDNTEPGPMTESDDGA